jgi:hypothetical protein
MSERDRGHSIPLDEDQAMTGPEHWWLRKARAAVKREPGQRDLAERLSRHANFHFEQSTLSRFHAGRQGADGARERVPVTFELMRALCKEFPELTPPPAFVASSEEAAGALWAVEQIAKTQPDLAVRLARMLHLAMSNPAVGEALERALARADHAAGLAPPLAPRDVGKEFAPTKPPLTGRSVSIVGPTQRAGRDTSKRKADELPFESPPKRRR